MDVLNLAAAKGDVITLQKVYNENIEDLRMYFLDLNKNRTFIHGAVKKNHYRFLSRALEILPSDIVLELITRTDRIDGSNPLHYAVKEGNIFIVKLLVNAYLAAAADLGYQGTPPWLIKNKHGNTPLHNCFLDKTTKSHGHVASYLVSRDHDILMTLGEQMHPSSLEQSTTMVLDKTGASILFRAMQKGFVELAEQILTSDFTYNVSGTNGENPLHYAAQCNEQVTRVLLEKHPELVWNEPDFDFGGTVLDKAVEDNARSLVKLMLIQDEGTPRPWNKACRRLIWHINPKSYGDTPLHIAARKDFIGIAKLLVRGYECAVREEAKEWDVPEAHLANDNLGVSPLHIENFHKEIPLIVALKVKHDDFAVYMLSSNHVSLNMAHVKDEEKNYAYEIAVKNRCTQSIRMIIEITKRLISEYLSVFGSEASTIQPSVLKIVQHFASSSKITGDVARLVVEAFPMFEREPQKEAKEHLKKAAENNEDWLVELLLEGDSSLIHDSTPAWQIACKKGHLSTLLAFLAPSHQQEFIRHCRDIKDTPLHHIKLSSCEEYKILMANPTAQELNNQVDSVGTTPLHRALEHKNINLINSLLETKGIKLDIQDQNQTTALDLLEEKLKTSGTMFRLYKKLLVMSIMTHELKNRVNKNGATSLHRAIEGNDYSLTKVLLETKGVKLDIEDKNHKTALVILEEKSVVDGYFFQLYEDLLENSLMTNELKNRVDKNGDTSLHRAIGQNAYTLAKALVHTKGVSLEIKDRHGKTALDLIEERCSIRSVDQYWYDMYKKLLLNSDRLHRMKNRRGSTGSTPLHLALEWDDMMLAKTLVLTKGIQVNIKDNNGKMALDLIEERCYQPDSVWYDLYEELLASNLVTYEMTNRVDVNGATSLQRAIGQNAYTLAKALVHTKGVSLEIKDRHGKTALDLIEERCSIRSVDQYWYDMYKKLLLNSDRLHRMKNRRGSTGSTPLHLALEWDDMMLAKTLVLTKGIQVNIKDNNGKMALDLIEERCYQPDSVWYDLYEELLASNLVTYEMTNRVDVNGATSLQRAIEQNANKLVKTMMQVNGVEFEIKDKKGTTAVDMIKEKCKDKSADMFWFERYKEILTNPDLLQKMKNHRDNSGVTPLHIAILWDDLKLTKKLVQSKGIELSIKDTKGKTAIDLIEEKCNKWDSLWYELYKDLLDNRNYLHELKNRRVGIDKETPLHRAIKWDDIKLAKVLLETKGVELDIEDRNGITALDLLQDRYTTGIWGELCREIRLDPSLKIFKFKYLQRRTSLKDMQNTLSVVAALLATITFAAGFTVPGGLDNNDGTATLGKHAAFLVFSVTNTLAMCSSMVVLFTVIGAMIWEAHPKATPLIDFCVSLLQLSLCGTIVAFMTGVYAIMAPKVIWAAIVVIVLCSCAFFVSLVVVSSFWPLLYKPFKLLKGVVCKLASHVQRWIFFGQQSGQPHDDPTMAALERNEPCSTAVANTLVINPGSDSSTTLGDSFQRSERQLSSNMDQSQRMNEALESLKIDINES